MVKIAVGIGLLLVVLVITFIVAPAYYLTHTVRRSASSPSACPELAARPSRRP